MPRRQSWPERPISQSRKRRTSGGRLLPRYPPRLRRNRCTTEMRRWQKPRLASAKAGLSQAEINLQRTEVRSPVDGYVTNLLMRVGDFARAGTPNLSVIDEHSYWIDAYFEETKLANIHVGDLVEAMLLGFQAPINGRIESITGGISAANAASSTQGLPNVDPIFTWVRLAQRIPVRIRIEQVPPEVSLVAGMTCSVSVVGGKGMPVARRDRRLFYRLENLL